MPQEHYNADTTQSGRDKPMTPASQRSLRLLTRAVWKRSGNEDPLPRREVSHLSAT